MKVKFSGIAMVDGRGKINGSVASKNRSGAYARVKVSPTNPQSTDQVAARSRLSSFSQAWRSLTQTQIAGWNAAAPSFAKSNVFGDKVNPTGKNLYTRLNTNLDIVGVAALTNPPLPAGAEQVTAGTAVSTHGGAISIAYNGTTAASKIQVWATAPLSPGVSFLKGKYRLLKSVAGNIASPIVITTEYNARLGNPAVGTKVGFMLKAVNATTGEESLPSTAETITV